MKRQDLQELHFITPISNVTSIMSRGILSHKLARRVQHKSVAMQEIQDRRAGKVVPRSRPLHDYVNLYICARNKMLYKIKDQHACLCIIRVKDGVLDIPGVVVSDRNASSKYALFAPAPVGLKYVDRDLVFADYWTHPDPFEQWRRGSIKCAEVLVPDRVDPTYIVGAYVSCVEAEVTFRATGVGIPVIISEP